MLNSFFGKDSYFEHRHMQTPMSSFVLRWNGREGRGEAVFPLEMGL
jgi:hypothetical protein